jgi:hypothetical protein
MAAFERYTGLAFRQGPAQQANQLIHEVRQVTRDELGAAVNYEIVLTGRAPDYLAREVAPKLAFFLRSKRYHVHQCRPVFLTMFLGDQVYFVHAEDFFAELRVAEGLADETFSALARSWEQSGRPAVAALPAPDPAHAAESVSLRPGNGGGKSPPGGGEGGDGKGRPGPQVPAHPGPSKGRPS